MRLIDADALKKSIEELKRSPWFNSALNPSWHAGIKEALEVVERLCIDKAPTIDAVPVIRCKDCRNKEDCQWYYYSEDDYGYCKWAERKPPQVNPEMVREMKERLEKYKND